MNRSNNFQKDFYHELYGAVSIKNLSLLYKQAGQPFLAVDDFCLDILPGQFVCLIGPSGCGKSSVLNSVGGFVSPSKGTVQ